MKLSQHLQIGRRALKHLYILNPALLIVTVVHTIIQAIIPYIPIYFSARLIDALFAGAGFREAADYALLTVGLVFLLSLASTGLDSWKDAAWRTMDRNQDWMYAEKAMSMSYSSIENREVSLLRERIGYESQTGFNLYFLISGIRRTTQHLTSLVASLALTISFFQIRSIPWWMKALFVLGVVLTTVIIILTGKKSHQKYAQVYEKANSLNLMEARLETYLDHYTTGKDIRLYAMAEDLDAFNSRNLQGFAKLSRQAELTGAHLEAPKTLLTYLMKFGAYGMLIYAALLGEVSIGSIARFVACVMMMLDAISGLTGAVQQLLQNHSYLERFFSYFDIPNQMYQGSLTVEKRDDNDYQVEFRDVSFKYPNTDIWALRHVNLKFNIGEKLAVVGMNGSGKTTFIKLLCRMYDPTEGEIRLNGVDIRKYDYDEYLSIFSVVFQDFQLFAFSLGENVAAGSQYDPERVKTCLKKAGFEERNLSTCLYKDFSANGVEISGGEAQKIALARALYKKAPFIILDEPTSALDPVSEYEIYSQFNRISGDRTAVYISHRLASCRFCDKIAVFHEGQVVQQGSHEALLADESGKYFSLWQAQAQYYAHS